MVDIRPTSFRVRAGVEIETGNPERPRDRLALGGHPSSRAETLHLVHRARGERGECLGGPGRAPATSEVSAWTGLAGRHRPWH